MASSEQEANPRREKKRAYLGNTQNNVLSNPCIKEQELSMKCIYENIDDKDACEVFFVNYKTCRAFWNQVIKERRNEGIMPYLPLPEDRAEIKAKRFNLTGQNP